MYGFSRDYGSHLSINHFIYIHNPAISFWYPGWLRFLSGGYTGAGPFRPENNDPVKTAGGWGQNIGSWQPRLIATGFFFKPSYGIESLFIPDKEFPANQQTTRPEHNFHENDTDCNRYNSHFDRDIEHWDNQGSPEKDPRKYHHKYAQPDADIFVLHDVALYIRF